LKIKRIDSGKTIKNAERLEIEINGKNYNAETVQGFDTYSGYEAKIVTGVNTKSGEAVAIFANGNWQFINPLVK
jgi:hypothetical protein